MHFCAFVVKSLKFSILARSLLANPQPVSFPDQPLRKCSDLLTTKITPVKVRLKIERNRKFGALVSFSVSADAEQNAQ